MEMRAIARVTSWGKKFGFGLTANGETVFLHPNRHCQPQVEFDGVVQGNVVPVGQLEIGTAVHVVCEKNAKGWLAVYWCRLEELQNARAELAAIKEEEAELAREQAKAAAERELAERTKKPANYDEAIKLGWADVTSAPHGRQRILEKVIDGRRERITRHLPPTASPSRRTQLRFVG